MSHTERRPVPDTLHAYALKNEYIVLTRQLRLNKTLNYAVYNPHTGHYALGTFDPNAAQRLAAHLNANRPPCPLCTTT